MATTRRMFLITGGAAILAACAGKPPPEPKSEIPQLTFAHRPKIVFNVASIDVQQPFVSKGSDPNVEHLLANPPARIAGRWARDRLVAGGANGLARFSILDASITQTRLKKDEGLSGLFKSQVDTRYDGRIEIRMDIENARGQGFATAVVTRSQTAREDLTLDERDALLIKFVEEMGRDLDQRLEEEIRNSLGQFLTN